MNSIDTELAARWTRIFSAAAQGLDIPPALLLRAEGLMEALVLVELNTPAGVQQAMAAHYLAVVGRDLEEDFGADWAEFYAFPQIPAAAARAPVYPSTKE